MEVLEDEPDLASHNFFIKSYYGNEQNKKQSCYLLTKEGCNMVGNKKRGTKGILFTAAHVIKFKEM